jgi:hypothetical protein
VAISVSNWVWDHSRSAHGARLVLLAIADEIRENRIADGTWLSNASLMRKTNLGERAVQNAVPELVKLGELDVEYGAGPRGCNVYRVVMTRTPAKSAPPQNLHPADDAPPQILRGRESPQVSGHTPAKSAPPADTAPPQNLRETPAKSAPEPSKDPENSLTESSQTHSADGALFAAPRSKSKPAKTSKQPVATRIPDDFAIDAAMREWATEKIPGYDIDAETENFIDWWRSKPGAAATKTDWPATWRTWMRKNAREVQAPHNAGPSVNGHGRSHQSYRNITDQSAYDTEELRPS